MQAKHEVKINGVTYESQPEIRKGSCEGCIALDSDSLCSDLRDDCHELGVIFIKKGQTMQPQETQAQPEVTTAEEPKYTVEEVLEAAEQVADGYFTDFQKKLIVESLAKKNNPDYKLYLELKAKFGE